MEKICFIEKTNHNGNAVYESDNKLTDELLSFLGYASSGVISEGRFDKIYDWLTKLNHEVFIKSYTEAR